MQSVAIDAAALIAHQYRVPHEDLVQEALIYIATHPEVVEKRIIKGGLPYMHWGVRSHLTKLAQQEQRQRGGARPLALAEQPL